MTRTTRRTLGFESVEGRVLLSVGMQQHHAFRHTHAMVHRASAQLSHVMLNGVLMGIPYGTAGQGGITVSTFNLTGRTRSLNKVSASLELNDNVIAPGQQPNLSNATLTLWNRRGSVQLKTAASPSNRYIFIVTTGTGTYANAYGSGAAAIAYNQRMHQYQIVLRSALH